MNKLTPELEKTPEAEVWKKLIFDERYEISSFGRLRSSARKLTKILKGGLGSTGYYQVSISGKMYKVHRLVALTFGIVQDGEMVNHIDGNPKNNHTSNLEKSNHSHNQKHAFRTGLNWHHIGETHPRAKLTRMDAEEIIKRYAAGIPNKQISNHFGVCAANVSSIALGKIWKELDGLRKELGIKRRQQKLSSLELYRSRVGEK